MENQEKVIDFNQAKTNKVNLEDAFINELRSNEQDENVSVPKDALNFLNNKMSNLQNTVEHQNSKIDMQNSKIDMLIETSGALINELKKQTIDETRPACKISRDNNRKDIIEVRSLNRHLDFYIFTGHIAELFQIYTNDKKKISSSSASNMLKELELKDDNNFSYLDPSSKKLKVRKYSFDIFGEIVDRLKYPEKYNLSLETTAKWITKCNNIPSKEQIELYLDNIKKGL